MILIKSTRGAVIPLITALPIPPRHQCRISVMQVGVWLMHFAIYDQMVLSA
jgi:hypothetical protein